MVITIRRIVMAIVMWKLLKDYNHVSKAKVSHRIMFFSQGKGLQTTYWLYGRDGYDKPLPKFDQ